MERKHVMGLPQSLVRQATGVILLILTGCSDSHTDSAIPEPQSEQSGFTANVSGAVNAEMSGEGIVTYLGPKERGITTGNRPGYFLITNLNTNGIGESQPTITFRIPDHAQAGNHKLVTSDPLKVGENFEVRVETVEEGQSVFYQTNTKGTITLDQFTPDRTFLGIGNINGTFEFITENTEGKAISANGTFDFPLPNKVVTEPSPYS